MNGKIEFEGVIKDFKQKANGTTIKMESDGKPDLNRLGKLVKTEEDVVITVQPANRHLDDDQGKL